MRHVRLSDFTGGMNTRTTPERLAENQAAWLYNVDLSSGLAVGLKEAAALDDGQFTGEGPYLTLPASGVPAAHAVAGDMVSCQGYSYRMERTGSLRRLRDDHTERNGQAGVPWLDSTQILTLTPTLRLPASGITLENGVTLPQTFITHAVRLSLVTDVQGRLDSLRVGDWIGFRRQSQTGAVVPPMRILAVGPVETITDYRYTEETRVVPPNVWSVAYAVEVLFDVIPASLPASFYPGLEQLTDQSRYSGGWYTPTYSELDSPSEGDFDDMDGVVFRWTSVDNTWYAPWGLPLCELSPFDYSVGEIAADESVTYTLRSAPPLARLWHITPGFVLHITLIGSVDEEQDENFYTALDVGEYRYAVTLELQAPGGPISETPPFRPGTSHGPVAKIVEVDLSWEQVQSPPEDPTWYPRVQQQNLRRVMKVDFAPGFDVLPAADFERFRMGSPTAINLYRTVKDGSEYWLVKRWTAEDQGSEFLTAPTTFYDDVRDATILVQGLIESLDNYPPLLVLGDSGGYGYATGDHYAVESDGTIWIATGKHLRFSKPGNPEAYPLSYGVDFRADVVGMAVLGPQVVVFLADGTIMRVAGSTLADLDVQQADGSLLCLKHECIREYRGQLLFPVNDGLARYNGVTADLANNEPQWSTMALTSAVVWDDRYIVFSPTGGYILQPGFYIYRGQQTGGWQVVLHSIPAHSALVTGNNRLVLGREGSPPLRWNAGEQTLQTISLLKSRDVELVSSSSMAHVSRVWIEAEGGWHVTVKLDGSLILAVDISHYQVNVNGEPILTRPLKMVTPFRVAAGARGQRLQVEAYGYGTFCGVEVSFLEIGELPRANRIWNFG